MQEALAIMHGLFAGEKLDVAGKYYTAHTAKLYSPPVGRLPIWMAAGGPKSATFAGRHAEGLITSVKEPSETLERVINPYREAAAARGAGTTVMATRWVVLASDDEQAWAALAPMRGLRAPGRLETADPAVLRERADAMDPADILAQYTIVRDLDELAEAYRPLITDVGADYVAIQVASVDPHRTIKNIGTDVLPRLRDWAS
jgi:coenzyme F420-dependent glucose-6-phosphate dehydrogenase